MAIKYVRATGGSDSNDGLSFANGWATLPWAFNSGNTGRIAAGDTLAICGDSTSKVFTLTATVVLSVLGTATRSIPVYLVAYSMLGIPLSKGNFVKITTSTAIATGLFRPNSSYIKFSNIYFDGGGTSPNAIYTSAVYEGLVFENCRFSNCASYGLDVVTTNGLGTAWKFISCEIDNNGTGGSSGGLISSNSGSFNFYGCKIHDNNGMGIRFQNDGIFVNNLIYNNSGDGFFYTGGTGDNLGLIYKNNISYGNSGNGFVLNTTSIPLLIVNNIFMSNGQYGIYANSSDIDILKIICTYNCSHNNTSGHININGGVLPGIGNITSDPLFVSVAAGYENFTLQPSSPCINAGMETLT